MLRAVRSVSNVFCQSGVPKAMLTAVLVITPPPDNPAKTTLDPRELHGGGLGPDDREPGVDRRPGVLAHGERSVTA